jgi:hypothetical protein
MKAHVQTLLQLRPDQRAALLELAEARRQPGKPPPLSEVARELLDDALKRRRAGRRGAKVQREPAEGAIDGD